MTKRCRVKICGITSVSDALMVCEAGVDAIGLVFYPQSPRHVELATAAAICRAVPPFVTKVGLFLNADAAYVEQALAAVSLDVLQFHGQESSEYCSAFSRPYIKALGMLGGQDLAQCAMTYQEALGLLVDSHAPGDAGGTGKTFDWAQIPHSFSKPLILAGGLRVENVACAIKTTQSYAVDVSSGVECRAGVKDPAKVAAFMQEVKRVGCE